MADESASIEDQLLVMDAQEGDARAMEKLVGRWQKRLWLHAFRLTADHHAAWDVTQQSWLGIIKGLRKLHDPACFRAWAYRITTNKSFDWLKRRKTAPQSGLDVVQTLSEEEKEETGVVELLQKLDADKRTVVSLFYFEELSVFEIAEALRIPPGTIKSRLANARKELKTLWEKHNEP
jgi:RNA polymerase sigma factor (sigma-70 family)